LRVIYHLPLRLRLPDHRCLQPRRCRSNSRRNHCHTLHLRRNLHHQLESHARSLLPPCPTSEASQSSREIGVDGTRRIFRVIVEIIQLTPPIGGPLHNNLPLLLRVEVVFKDFLREEGLMEILAFQHLMLVV
jgi:hypothetical protein